MIFASKRALLSGLIVLVIGLSACSQQQSTVYLSKQMASKVLKQNVAFSVYLPAEYFKKPTVRFPVLYLLHGFGGDETSWLLRSNLAHIADSLIAAKAIPPCVIILPDGGNSYFINNFDQSFAFEDFFVFEFIPYINANYRVLSDQAHSAIGGLSMGGFGAVIVTIKHPNLFGTTIALSAAVRTPQIFIELPSEAYHLKFATVYGDSLIGPARITEHFKENSPFFLIDSTSADTLKRINWYIDCGMQDFLYSSNAAFHDLLIQYKIPHEYHMRIGEHNWNYWHDGFINSMVYLGRKWK